MKIREYDELDVNDILELNQGSLGWFLSPEKAEKIRRVDPHVPDYFAIFGVERGRVVSQVGAVTVKTETISGEETIGFIWGVCTDPKAARKGIAGRLMGEIESRLRGEGPRYVLLGTSKGFVAYNLYRKLGYTDFIRLRWAIKECKSADRPSVEMDFAKTTRDNVFSEMFDRYSEDLLGFIHRHPNLIKIKKAWGWPPINIAGTFQEKEKIVGYVLANKEGKTLKIEEIIAPKPGDLKDMIKVLERKYKPRYILFNLLDGSHGEKICNSMGFTGAFDTWAMLMIKDIKARRSIKDFRKMYGIGKNKFLMTSLDMY